jgi:hypothetical protein
MKSRLQRKIDGPGWVEVIFGAALSLLLGVVLAVVFLVFKPVTMAKEMPKEPAENTVYYVEGTREGSKIREVSAKRRLMAEGRSVVLNEDELNTLVMPPNLPPQPKKMELPQPEQDPDMIVPGLPNFRVRDNVMQIGVPVELNAYEMKHKIVLQTRGAFAKSGESVIFQPADLYIGSCPLGRLPAVRDFVVKKIFQKSELPDDVVAAWKNVADATIEGSTLRLTAR